jgi:long-subunit acyl-CoA synthetase (AMP-forming)
MRKLFSALGERSETAGLKTAFDDGGRRLSHAALAKRVAGAAEEICAIAPAPPVIGLLGSNSIDWVVGQLAGWLAGKIVVPLPGFLRVPQLRHIVQDAGVSHILATREMVATARLLGAPVTPISEREASPFVPAHLDCGQIIYTSGSTGQPKGVLLRSGQMIWTAEALIRVIGAQAGDSYLSILPLALLLETICAIVIPILAGAPVKLANVAMPGLATEGSRTIADLVADHRPSCMVLVPQLLAQWTTELDAAGMRAPDSLRFVAVGGAATPPAPAEHAWDLGIPVYEGYGLSECGSVVALNHPGERTPNSVGKPLPGLDVHVERGEIVVRGPSVMDRYVHGAPTNGTWKTGDLGKIAPDGTLMVHGRADNVLVTSIGRNVSPEWIETLLCADPRVGHSLVTHVGGPHLAAVLVPTERGQAWFDRATPAAVRTLIEACCHEAPAYAVPRDFVVTNSGDLIRFGLLTENGRIKRKAMHEFFARSLLPQAAAAASTSPRS